MIPPPVQYVTTGDGVRIAFTVCGEGPPVVVLSEPSASHVELEWSQAVLGTILARLVERARVVRLDIRATGLSDRVQAPGDDPVLGDVRAVVEHLKLTKYTLAGVQGLTPAAIIYAAQHADAVEQLVLIDPALRVMDMIVSPQMSAIITAAQADWTIATEAIGLHVFGVGRAESKDFGAHVRACIGPEFYRIALQATQILDATTAAPRVCARTLVVRHAEHPYISPERAREVAATIPGAQMITVPGLWADDPAGMTDRILSWLAAR
jgi:pimeloyl-ACP methyl ester carboxylesterase